MPPPFIQQVPMSALNFRAIWQQYQSPGQATPSFWHHGAHPSSTTFYHPSHAPLPQAQVFFIISHQFIFKIFMVRLTFKTHHFIATTFKRKKALKIVIFTNLKCFLIFFYKFFLLPIISRGLSCITASLWLCGQPVELYFP